KDATMDEAKSPWSTNWLGQMVNSIRSLGFTNLTQLLASMPCRPYSEVAGRLREVAPIQIIKVQFLEAKSEGRVREAAIDCLCRNLIDQLPEGWGVGENAEWQSVRALSSWTSEVQATGECEEWKSTLLAIAKALRETPPPAGWIPKGQDDSV